jgi:hypothetical protein
MADDDSKVERRFEPITPENWQEVDAWIYSTALMRGIWEYLEPGIPKPSDEHPAIYDAWIKKDSEAKGILAKKVAITDLFKIKVATSARDAYVQLKQQGLGSSIGMIFNNLSKALSVPYDPTRSLSVYYNEVRFNFEAFKGILPPGYSKEKLIETLEVMSIIRTLQMEGTHTSTINTLLLQDTLDIAKVRKSLDDLQASMSYGEMYNSKEPAKVFNSRVVENNRLKTSTNEVGCMFHTKVERYSPKFHSTYECIIAKALARAYNNGVRYDLKSGQAIDRNKIANLSITDENLYDSDGLEVAHRAVRENENIVKISPNINMFADSGSTCHIANQRSLFVDYRPCKIKIKGVAGPPIYSEGIGTLYFRPLIRGIMCNRNIIKFKNCLHVPNASDNLLSLLNLTGNGKISIKIDKLKIKFYDTSTQELLFTALLFYIG